MAEQNIAVKKEIGQRVLVVGGGVSGLLAANSLGQKGFTVFLVEEQPVLGGNLRELEYLAAPEIKPQEIIAGLQSNSGLNHRVTVLLSSIVVDVKGYVGDFQVTVASETQTQTVLCDMIVAATGFIKRYESSNYRIDGQCNNVVTLSNFEGMDWAGLPHDSIIFWSAYESKSMCAAILKSALLALGITNKKIYVLLKNIKVAGDGLEMLYQEARDRGVLFFKYNQLPQVILTENAVRILMEDILLNEEVELGPGLLVLGERWEPHPQTAGLAAMLRVHLDGKGYFQDDNSQHVPVRSNRKGIFFSGACRQAMDIEELVRDAGAVVAEVEGLCKDGYLTPRESISTIDQDLCKFCLTCYRSCPHQAIATDYENQAARVVEVACEGCGVCVGECPAKAIKLENYDGISKPAEK
jgi:heterodisulfide reductase subunit A2